MTPQQAISALDRQLAVHGQDVTLRTYSGSGEAREPSDVMVRVLARDYRPSEVGGGVVQGMAKFIMSPTQIVSEAWPSIGDFIVWQAREYRVSAAPRIELQGEVVRIDLEAEG